MILYCYDLYLLTNDFQLLSAQEYNLGEQLDKVFKIAILFFPFSSYVNLNGDLTTTNLIFDRVAVLQLIKNSFWFASPNDIKRDNSNRKSKQKSGIQKVLVFV